VGLAAALLERAACEAVDTEQRRKVGGGRFGGTHDFGDGKGMGRNAMPNNMKLNSLQANLKMSRD
jgi:hypothetical protein